MKFSPKTQQRNWIYSFFYRLFVCLFRWSLFASGSSNRCSWDSQFDITDHVRGMAWSYLFTKNEIQVNYFIYKFSLNWNFNAYAIRSREGALNLLRDFEGVSEWIRACKYVRPEHVEILAKHEVLRTCEGVGKILLRKPFEIISMTEQTSFSPRKQQKSNGNLFLNVIFCV